MMTTVSVVSLLQVLHSKSVSHLNALATKSDLGHGQPRVFFNIHFIKLEPSMQHVMFQDHRTFGSKRDLKNCLPYMDMGTIFPMSARIVFFKINVPLSEGGTTKLVFD